MFWAKRTRPGQRYDHRWMHGICWGGGISLEKQEISSPLLEREVWIPRVPMSTPTLVSLRERNNGFDW